MLPFLGCGKLLEFTHFVAILEEVVEVRDDEVFFRKACLDVDASFATFWFAIAICITGGWTIQGCRVVLVVLF